MALLACVGVLGAAATSASAATRLVAVGAPASGDCLTAPCEIEYAVESVALSGDTIMVATGTYDLGGEFLDPRTELTIQGADPAAKPVITGSSCGTIVSLLAASFVLRDLDVRNTGAGNCGNGAIYHGGRDLLVERVIVRAGVLDGIVSTINAVIRDSLVIGGYAGVSVNYEADLVNVTVIGGRVGVVSRFGAVRLRNVIAQGQADIAVGADWRPAFITAEYSNYDTAEVFGGSSGSFTEPGTGTGNQTAAPVFVNAAGGDYRQAPNSPTIDAGTMSGTPPVSNGDLFGDPAPVGAARDIGAHESQHIATTLTAKPAVLTLSPLGLSLFEVSATLTTSGGTPVSGQTITFSAGTTTICAATTTTSGAATCSGALSALSIALNNGYTATFTGTATYLPSGDTAPLIG